MILMIDNYDSFVYNLYQYLLMLGKDVQVVRNDKLTLSDVDELNPEALVISPGPCTPLEAGLSVPVIQEFYGRKPILGICLGHQSIGYAFGATVRRASRVMHGKTSMINHTDQGVFSGLDNPLEVMRYHSLVVDADTLSDNFEITAISEDDGEIMGMRHKKHLLEGIQFHPESIMTPQGMDMLRNFLNDVEAFYS